MKNKKSIFFTFLASLLFCKLTYWLFTFPNPDEAYYWLWGRFPALSYHEHPALQSLTQALFYKLFGKSLFALRLPIALSLIADVLIYYSLLKRLNRTTNIPLVILSFFSIPLFFLFTSFAWNDYMMITMILSSGYFWLNFLTDRWDQKRGRDRDLFLAFAFLGLAALSKYNSVFMAFAIATLIVVNKPLRSVLKDYRFYLGILLCLFVISPIIIWNIQNQFSSFEFVLGQRTLAPFLDGQFFKGNIAGFVIGSILLVPPTLWWFAISNRKSIERSFNTDKSSNELVYRKMAIHLFLWSSLSFLFLSIFSNVLYYWNIPAYLFIIPLWIVVMQELNLKMLIATLVYSTLVNFILVFHFAILPWTSFIDGAEDRDCAYYYGWEKIGDTVEHEMSKSTDGFQIFTCTYRTASLLSFQLNKTDVYSYSSSFDQFDFWTNKIKFKNDSALILTDDWMPINDEIKAVVENISLIDTIPIERFGYKIKNYYLYKAAIRDEFKSE